MLVEHYKKGFLVLPIIVFSMGLVTLSWKAVANALGIQPDQYTTRMVLGTSLFLAGVLNWYFTRNYTINMDGEEEYHEEEGTFMFIKVTLWTRIFFVVGVLVILAALADKYKL